MRFLHLTFAALLLISSVTASACHSVGDVHVICSNGQTSALYVETQNEQEAQTNSDCCPMAGFALADMGGLATRQLAHLTQNSDAPQHAHIIRSATQAHPRAPPQRLFF